MIKIHRKHLSGITLVEMLVSLGALSILMTVLFALLNTSTRILYSNQLYEGLKEEGQRSMRYLDRDIIRAKKIFGRGSNYPEIIATSGLPPIVSFSKLPAVNPVGVFDIHSAAFSDTIFGNEFFFAKVENGARFDVGSLSYEINLYRFIHVYLTMDTTHKSRPYDYTLALVKWESGLYADFWELEHIWEDPIHDSEKILDTLNNVYGVYYCWDPSEKDAEKAFYRIGSFNTPASIYLQTSDYRFIVRAIDQTLGISFNRSDSFPVADSVPAFSETEDMFPGGLEFGVVGPTSSRVVLMRMVLAGWTRKQVLSYVSATMVSAPEY